MKYFTFILFSFLCLSIFSSCEEFEYINVFFDRTECAEPWHVEDASASEYGDNALLYLASQGIDVRSRNFDSQGPDADPGCTGCSCTTGDRLIVDVNKTDLDAIKLLGFYED